MAKTYKIKGLDIEITEEQLNELNKQRENKGEKYFFPKDGEAYYFAHNIQGHILKNVNNTYSDRQLISRGVSSTEELAKKEDEKRLALVRMWKWVQDNGLFFEPDWSDSSQIKYYPCYESELKMWDWSRNAYIQYNFILPYFKSKEDCQKFIDNNLSDLNLFL